MKDYRSVERMVDETIEDLHDRIETDLMSAYNAGYEAGLKAKDYAESGHCTGCAYEGLAKYREPCSECRNSHKNMYKEN